MASIRPDVYQIALITLLLVGSGCAAPSGQSLNQTATSTSQFPMTNPMQTLSLIITTTPLPSPVPVKPTATQTLALKKVTLTITIQPTLNVIEAKGVIQGLIQNNGNCRLPCLWGITPGVSDLSTLKSYSLPSGESSIPGDFYLSTHSKEQSGSITAFFWEGNVSSRIRFTYYNTGTSIDLLGLSAESDREEGEGFMQTSKGVFGDPFFHQTLNYYLLSNILNEYGPPSSILILPFPNDPDRLDIKVYPFSLVLFYPDQGIFVEYIMMKEKSNGNWVGCPTKVGYLNIILWPTDVPLSFEEVVSKNSGLGINELNLNRFKSIEEATSMTVDDFYQKYKNSNYTECLKTPKNLWPALP